MSQVVLFHHALGLTDGVRALARTLSDAGNTVHTPDLFEGKVFGTIEEGVGYASETGFGTIIGRGVEAAAALPPDVVVAGISLGVLPAQCVAQTRPGVRAAVLLEACVPPSEFGIWPDAVPVQVHGMDDDPFFAQEGDLDAARALVAQVPNGELFLYPGGVHLFSDSGLPSYDADATALLTTRVLDLLARVG